MKNAYVLFEKRAAIMSPEFDEPIAVVTANCIKEAVDFLGADVDDADIKDSHGNIRDNIRVTFSCQKLTNDKNWIKIEGKDHEGKRIIEFRRVASLSIGSPSFSIVFRKDTMSTKYNYRLIRVCWLP